MPDPLSLLQHAVGQPQRQLVFSTVSSAKPLPASFNDLLYVVTPGWSTDLYQVAIDDWPAINGATLPAAGAECLLISDGDNWRCVWWDGEYTAPGLQAPSGTMTSQTRAFGTAYQPNVTRPTQVIVTFTLPSSGANCFAKVLMDGSNPPATQIALAQCSNAAATLVQIQTPVTFLVPAGSFYELAVGAGSPTITSTFEYTL